MLNHSMVFEQIYLSQIEKQHFCSTFDIPSGCFRAHRLGLCPRYDEYISSLWKDYLWIFRRRIYLSRLKKIMANNNRASTASQRIRVIDFASRDKCEFNVWKHTILIVYQSVNLSPETLNKNEHNLFFFFNSFVLFHSCFLSAYACFWNSGFTIFFSFEP